MEKLAFRGVDFARQSFRKNRSFKKLGAPNVGKALAPVILDIRIVPIIASKPLAKRRP